MPGLRHHAKLPLRQSSREPLADFCVPIVALTGENDGRHVQLSKPPPDGLECSGAEPPQRSRQPGGVAAQAIPRRRGADIRRVRQKQRQASPGGNMSVEAVLLDPRC